MLLSRPWTLFDVDDVEALLAHAVARTKFARDLNPAERDDLLCDLFRIAWQLAGSFDPARGSFSTYLHATAQRRAIDWYRKERGRTVWRFAGHTVERKRPQLLSLDDERGLVESLASGGGDPADGGDADLAGVLDARGRSRLGDLETLGLWPPRGAPR